MDGKAGNGSDGKHDRHAALVLRGAVGNCTCDCWRENIADDVARGWACQRAQRGSATCQNWEGKAQEQKEEPHVSAALAAQNKAGEDQRCVLQHDRHAGRTDGDGHEGKDDDESGKHGNIGNGGCQRVLFHVQETSTA